MKAGNRNQLLILAIVTFSFSRASGADCGCSCKWLPRSGKKASVCQFLEDLNIVVETNKGALINWNKYFSFVERFSENWRQDIASIVEEQVGKRSNGIPRVDLKTEGTTEVETKNPEISDFESRLLEVEKRTQDLEKKLAEEQDIRKQLERDVAGTRATLTDLTEQIMNLTLVEITSNVLPRFLKENMHVFVEYLRDDLRKLRRTRSVNELGILNGTIRENPGLFPEDTEMPDVVASRLGSLEENMKTLNSSIGGILTTIHCVDCEKWAKKRLKWKKEYKKKYKKSKDEIGTARPIWDDY